MLSIFVQIASYEDPELYKTIADAIEKSSKETNIVFGVHASYVNPNDISVPKTPQVKLIHTTPPNNLGLGASRSIAHSLYSGEDFYLQIDSHSRFKINWDLFLISEYYRYRWLGIEKPMITAYPVPFGYKDGVEFFNNDDWVNTIKFNYETETFKNLRFPKQTQTVNLTKSLFTPSVSGGSIFTKGPGVLPNKKIMFMGEEIVIAAMAYTRGYDLVLPQQPYMYHLYYGSCDASVAQRKLVWNEWTQLNKELSAASDREIYEMFTQNKIGEDYLGTERTLKEFSEYSGLNFDTGEVTEVCY